MPNYSWTGPIIMKRVRDAVILNLRRAFTYDPLFPYVQNLTLTPITGTITVTTGSPQVVGSGTTFLASLYPGNPIQFPLQPGVTYYVQSVTDGTHLKLTTNYTGSTMSNTTLNLGTNATVDFACTRIVINDATPQDYYSLPSINVMSASGEEHRFIQEDHFEGFEDANGNQSDRRGAPMDITLTIEAMALDVVTRDQLADRLYESFKIITTDLADNGIGILKTSINADRRKYENDRWFYTSGVTMRMYVEWLDENITPVNSDLTGLSGVIYTDAGVVQPFKLNNI